MPWLRRPSESRKADEAAQLYFTLRVDRSIAKVAQMLGKSISLTKRWSKKHRWVKRAQAYDAWMADIEQEAAEVLARQDAEKWALRERDRRERLFLCSEQMLDRAKGMLEYPLAQVSKTTKVDGDGRAIEITAVQPAKWTLHSAARLVAVAQVVGSIAIRNEGAVHTGTEEVDEFDDLVPYRAGT